MFYTLPDVALSKVHRKGPRSVAFEAFVHKQRGVIYQSLLQKSSSGCVFGLLQLVAGQGDQLLGLWVAPMPPSSVWSVPGMELLEDQEVRAARTRRSWRSVRPYQETLEWTILSTAFLQRLPLAATDTSKVREENWGKMVFSSGYYGDPEAECQSFHICANDGNGGLLKYSFLCPNGTLFNQQYFICDWWFNTDCSQVTSPSHILFP